MNFKKTLVFILMSLAKTSVICNLILHKRTVAILKSQQSPTGYKITSSSADRGSR